MEGKTLHDLLTEFPLSPEVTLKLYAQIISGLRYLHSIGVAHRDLKPDNIIVDDNFNLTIIDMGGSILYGENENMVAKPFGTITYSPPEYFSPGGEGFNLMKSDVWSAGIILYEMVHGEVPFEGLSIHAI